MPRVIRLIDVFKKPPLYPRALHQNANDVGFLDFPPRDQRPNIQHHYPQSLPLGQLFQLGSMPGVLPNLEILQNLSGQ